MPAARRCGGFASGASDGATPLSILKMPMQECGRPRSRSAGVLLLAASVLSGLAGCALDSASRGTPVSLPGPGVAVFAAGDIADCGPHPPEHSGAARTAALVEAQLARDGSAVVLTLGDHTYPVGRPAEFTDCYHPTWGRFKSRTFPAPGNHEYRTPGASGYFDYFGDAAGPGRRGYYSFRLGTWHVVSLNSNLRPPEHAAQLAWLKADLERHPSPCTLAFWHHPRYSSGGHGNNGRMADVWEVLQAAGADVALTSHDHDYERFVPQNAHGRRDDARGIRQFVAGTGGAALTPFWFPKFNSEATDNSVHGVLKMVLRETGYEWTFLPVDGGGFTDRGAALCH